MPPRMNKARKSPARNVAAASAAVEEDANAKQPQNSSMYEKVKNGTNAALGFSWRCVTHLGSMIYKKKTEKVLDLQRLSPRQRLSYQRKVFKLREAKKTKAQLDAELDAIISKVEIQTMVVEEAAEELQQEIDEMAMEQNVITIGGVELPSISSVALCVGAGAAIAMYPQETMELAKSVAVYTLQSGRGYAVRGLQAGLDYMRTV